MGQPSCDELADYSVFDANYTLNSAHELHVTTDLSWNSTFDDMNVHGLIIIESGVTLTIDNATIHFADTRQMTYRTAIIVHPGGHLVVQNNSVLTSLDECPDSMWDGVVVMGVPTAPENSGLQGLLTMSSGAVIRNAWVGAITGFNLSPDQWGTEAVTYTGGIVSCENASFINNVYGVVLRPYDHPGNLGETETHFFGCTFAADGPMPSCPDEGDVPPPPPGEPCGDVANIMLYANGIGHLRIGGCTFYNNNSPVPQTNATLWGDGIVAFNTSISILSLCDGVYTGMVPCEAPGGGISSTFTGLFRAVAIADWSPDKYAEVVRCKFYQNIRGLHLQGVSHSTVIRNTVHVPLDPGNILSPRGISFANCTAFEVQENELVGAPNNDFSQANTGMWFSTTGSGPNTFYKNTFGGRLTIGTIIQGQNDGSGGDDGLEFKCNNWGPNNQPNRYDLAFTGPQVSVGNQQGAYGDQTTPAGNTFSPTCPAPATQMWRIGPMDQFTYWHHDPFSTMEVVLPVCRTNPPLVDDWFQNTNAYYGNGVDACQSQTDLFGGNGGEPVLVLEAEQNYVLLREVYDEVRDGGDTQGLKDYIGDPTHTSYDVRNQLMLVAPDVSLEVWQQVFAMDPPMNPWHLAQALLANVPLQAAVLDLMDASDLTSYYRQLVRGAQGNGISNLTIKESELSYWRHRRERALNAHASAALRNGDPVVLHDALTYHEAHPQYGLPLNQLGLLMAMGDFTEAKVIVDDLMLAAEPDETIEVLGMYLDLVIAGQTIADVSTSDRARLHDIADRMGAGQGQAQAWLECIGDGPFEDGMILPGEQQSLQMDGSPDGEVVSELLAAYPNPSDGKQPVYVVVCMPEGMEKVTLRVMDPLGRTIKEEVVTRKAAIIELDPSGMAKGFYLSGFYADDVQVAASKFEVIH